MYTSEKRIYLNADKTEVVEEGSPDAAFLLVGEGGQISEDEAAKYGLMGKRAQREALAEEEAARADEAPAKAQQPATNKAKAPGDNK